MLSTDYSLTWLANLCASVKAQRFLFAEQTQWRYERGPLLALFAIISHWQLLYFGIIVKLFRAVSIHQKED